MALSNQLAKAGHEPKSVRTTAQVHLVKGADGFSITKIELSCRAHVPGIDDTPGTARQGLPLDDIARGVRLIVEAVVNQVSAAAAAAESPGARPAAGDASRRAARGLEGALQDELGSEDGGRD